MQHAKTPIIGMKSGPKSLFGKAGLVPKASVYASSSILSSSLSPEIDDILMAI